MQAFSSKRASKNKSQSTSNATDPRSEAHDKKTIEVPASYYTNPNEENHQGLQAKRMSKDTRHQNNADESEEVSESLSKSKDLAKSRDLAQHAYADNDKEKEKVAVDAHDDCGRGPASRARARDSQDGPKTKSAQPRRAIRPEGGASPNTGNLNPADGNARVGADGKKSPLLQRDLEDIEDVSRTHSPTEAKNADQNAADLRKSGPVAASSGQPAANRRPKGQKHSRKLSKSTAARKGAKPDAIAKDDQASEQTAPQEQRPAAHVIIKQATRAHRQASKLAIRSGGQSSEPGSVERSQTSVKNKAGDKDSNKRALNSNK